MRVRRGRWESVALLLLLLLLLFSFEIRPCDRPHPWPAARPRKPGKERQEVLSSFYDQWKDDTLVMLIWLSVQAQSEIPGNLESVRALMDHSAFDIKNPNKVRCRPSLVSFFFPLSLTLSFARAYPPRSTPCLAALLPAPSTFTPRTAVGIAFSRMRY